jgi:hypothetical protein
MYKIEIKTLSISEYQEIAACSDWKSALTIFDRLTVRFARITLNGDIVARNSQAYSLESKGGFNA